MTITDAFKEEEKSDVKQGTGNNQEKIDLKSSINSTVIESNSKSLVSGLNNNKQESDQPNENFSTKPKASVQKDEEKKKETSTNNVINKPTIIDNSIN